MSLVQAWKLIRVSQSFADRPYATSAETAEYTSAISVALLTTVAISFKT